MSKWSSCTWTTPLAAIPSGNAYALKWHQNALYVAGSFSGSTGADFVGKLTGTNFTPVGNGFAFDGHPEQTVLHPGVRAVQVIDGDLFVAGDFTSSGGNTNIQFIARLDAVSNIWASAGNGLNNSVRAIAEFGDAIYVGGDFTASGTNTAVQYVAKLVNGQWQAVGSGVNGRVVALTAHNGRLFVGGDFTTAGGLSNANCIACWDGKIWSTINNGVSDGTYDSLWPTDATDRVDSIAARGNEIYVGGDFTKAWNGDRPVTANYVARAAWDETAKAWSWSALDGGLSRTEPTYVNRLEHARAIVIRDRTNSAGYDVIVGGSFTRAGGLPSYDLARWVVGISDCPTTGPSVQITAPAEGAIITGTNVTVTATASTNTIQVDFYRNGLLFDVATQSPWQWITNDYTPGSYSVTAVATDNQTNSASSAPVNFTVKAATGPTPTNDTFYVLATGVATNLNVLVNDASSGGSLRLVGVNKWANPFTTLRIGSVKIGYGATNLVYHVNPYSFGTNFISYDVADTNGTNVGNATIIVRAPPTIQITYPTDDLRTASPLQTPLIVSGTTFDWDGAVSNVKLLTNNVQWSSQVTPTSSNTFSFSISSLNVGFYTLAAVATDNHGYTNTSAPVDVNVFNTVGSAAPVAHISNPVATITNNHGIESIVYPVIREGLFTNLICSAYDPDNTDDAYAVFLYRPDDPNNPFANLTPSPTDGAGFHVGTVTNDFLGTLDFSAIPNGIYDLVLFVRGGGDQTNAIVRVSLDTQLKIGQFSFSEQDLVIPVNGIPLTVIRTYNSFNPVEGDFGFNWTYAINDMDVVIDEDRQIVPAITALDLDDPLDKTGLDLNLRVGGGRNITLTLPDGRRTTFRFTFGQTTSGEICPGCVDAQWIPAPGVFAKLTTPSPATFNSIGDNSLIPLWGLGALWQAGGLFTPMDAFDFPKFILTMQDGTKYEISRDLPGQTSPTYVYQDETGYFGETFVISYIQPHPNKPRVSKIEQRTGDTIVINPGDIAHFPPGSTNATRTVWFERDTRNRITAIRDPIGGSDGLPVVKYVYNDDTGNLIRVLKLVDRTAGSYITNTYRYDNPNFPHFITEIDDARGIPAARNLYDDSGRLIGMIDADGRTNTITHNLTNRIEQLVDRLGKTNIYAYDTRGNVTAITNALNQVTLYAYDDLNNKTNEVIGGVQTNNYVYDTSSFLLQSVVGELMTNSFTYNANGQVLTSTDGRGNVTTNQFDGFGNLTNFVTLLSTNRITFDTLGRLSSTLDPLGNFTTNLYDNIGNLTNVTVRDFANNLLSKTSYTYDPNGNPQSQSVQRTPASGSAINDVTTYVYDGQNRVTQTVDPDGKTNIVVFNEIGKQTQTIDKLGHTNSYFYDARASLTNVMYADSNFEQYF